MTEFTKTMEQAGKVSKAEIIEAQELAKSFEKYSIKTQEQMQDASKSLQDIKKRINKLEDQRFEITRPMDEAKKKITALFTPALDFYKAAERCIKSAIGTHVEEQDKKDRAEAARAADKARKESDRLAALAEKEAAKGNAAKAEELATRAEQEADNVPIFTVPVKTKGVTIEYDHKAEVVNAAIVPREFLIPDERAIKAYVKSTKGAHQIPGVRIWKEVKVGSRSS